MRGLRVCDAARRVLKLSLAGDLLLDADRTPEFGAIDYLVENGIGGVSDSSLHAYIGSSGLTAAGGGVSMYCQRLVAVR